MRGKLFIVLYVLLNISIAATIHGVVYDATTFSEVSEAMIEVNTTPVQRIVAKENYSLELPPGDYLFKAKHYKDNKLVAYGEENITIIAEGDYTVDIILFGPGEFFYDEPYFLNLSVDWLENVSNVTEQPQIISKTESSYPIFLFLLVAGVLLAALMLKRRKVKIEKSEGKKEVAVKEPQKTIVISKDLQELVSIIKKNEGRITQKELRKIIPYSEAKVSLMLDELEEIGVVKKIKKGRGNIIILKEV